MEISGVYRLAPDPLPQQITVGKNRRLGSYLYGLTPDPDGGHQSNPEGSKASNFWKSALPQIQISETFVNFYFRRINSDLTKASGEYAPSWFKKRILVCELGCVYFGGISRLSRWNFAFYLCWFACFILLRYDVQLSRFRWFEYTETFTFDKRINLESK